MIELRPLLLSFLAMTLAVGTLEAQQETPTRAELEKMVQERDALIDELQAALRELATQIHANDASPAADASSPEGVAAAPRTGRSGPGVQAAAGRRPDDPSRFEVDEVAAERALERTLVQSGALLLPRGRVEFVPTLSYQVTETDLPVSIDTSAGTAVEGKTTRNGLILDLLARIGLPGDSQLEIGLPLASIEQHTRFSTSGVTFAEDDQTARAAGDLRLGFSKTLVRERGWRPDIVGRLAYGFGNGDRTMDGVALSSGFDYLDATLSFVKRRDPLALFFSLGYTDVDEDGGIDPGNIYSVSLGTALAASPASSLFGAINYSSVAGTRVDGIAVPASDIDVASISLGMSTLIGRGQLLNISTEVGLSDVAPDYALSFSLPMQW